jgi:hypothetical protein
MFTLTAYQRSDVRLGRATLLFCGRDCHIRWRAEENRNGPIQTEASRDKLRATKIAAGDARGHSYRKVRGRHEHRTAAEQVLGRVLVPGEVVHHIDGDKRNNHPSNLQVMSQSEHAKHHFNEYRRTLRGRGARDE